MKSLTIRAVARHCGLSRSTLLYYDRLGLLSPSARSKAGYRLYAATDMARLERLLLYRDAGLPLAAIRQLLDAADDKGRGALTARLEQINREIQALRAQQRIVARLLGEAAHDHGTRALTKEAWIGVLRATGLSDADMRRWHREFEQRAPEAHHDFLEALGIPSEEIARIRTLSRSHAT